MSEAPSRQRSLASLVLSGLVLLITGCTSTFDQHGNLRFERSPVHQHAYEPFTPEEAQFMAERSVQLWQPRWLNGSDETTYVSQAAIISEDGYAITAAHALTGGDTFTLHSATNPDQYLRVHLWDTNGVHHVTLDGTKEISKAATFRPIRTVHVFEEDDLALIRLPTGSARRFLVADAPPSRDTAVSLAFNPIIHPQLPGMTAPVVKQKKMEGQVWRVTVAGAAIFGDSGGAATDAEGNLVGNIIGSNVSRLSWGDGKRVFDVNIVGAPNALLQKLIEEDRARPNADPPPAPKREPKQHGLPSLPSKVYSHKS